LQTWAESLPVGGCRHEDDPLAIRDRGSSESTDGAIQKLLVLVELHNVIARARAYQEPFPRLARFHGVVELTLQVSCTADNGPVRSLTQASLTFHCRSS